MYTTLMGKVKNARAVMEPYTPWEEMRESSPIQKIQDCKYPFDVNSTCEESIFNRIVEDLCAREQETCQTVHVINVDTDDTLEDTTLGALIICELCQRLQHADDLKDHLAQLLLAVEGKTGRSFFHMVCFY
ncbi:hypothetical protein J1605_001362 [Eschrichtius robustus]|uniref:RNA polymerase II subunit A C-terminal domain phosphatase SSU72 n=1 Tax=Eschrichtius robustus TaxID=9764 RepID=A0AB34I159_ESCRO|nr:hypothetical protein J1605_001362 [Eschrichtius robustus]